MAKIIRHSYPKELGIGLLLLVFVVSFFLSGGVFEKKQPLVYGFVTVTLGELLVATTVVILAIILWEEVLFPVKVKPIEGGGMIFRNHRTKLIIQALIYLTIPAIVVFIYSNYAINPFRFFSWAIVCLVAPVAGKLASGIKNYNDFLKLTSSSIEYKNNRETGTFSLENIRTIILIKDETQILHKIILELVTASTVTIDLDEMELDAYYESIDHFISTNYPSLLKGVN